MPGDAAVAKIKTMHEDDWEGMESGIKHWVEIGIPLFSRDMIPMLCFSRRSDGGHRAYTFCFLTADLGLVVVGWPRFAEMTS